MGALHKDESVTLASVYFTTRIPCRIQPYLAFLDHLIYVYDSPKTFKTSFILFHNGLIAKHTKTESLEPGRIHSFREITCFYVRFLHVFDQKHEKETQLSSP